MFKKVVAVLVIILCIYSVQSYPTKCLSPNGTAVDWFLILKYPGNLTSNPRIAYIDSTNKDGQWTLINHYADEYNGAIEKTIYMINSLKDNDKSLLLFNDQPPNSPWSPTGAHAKGIVAYSNSTQQGVYILHSAPKYANHSEDGKINYSLPSNTRVYGQHFYCWSFGGNILPELLQNLIVIQPVTYYKSGIFANMTFKNTNKFVINQWKLANGDKNIMFSKSPDFVTFLYEGIIQPYLGVDMMTETWGRPYLPNLCTPEGANSIMNINLLKFPSGDSWDHYSDHAKWAVTTGSSNIKLACLCDINRQETQNIRGGSCLCNDNPQLYKALTSIIAGFDSCT